MHVGKNGRWTALWLARGALAACGLLAMAAQAASPDVAISQVYGGGGNTGATYKNDFVELYNRGTTAVSLSGWSVQYTSSAGTTFQVTALSGTIQPGHYYLVQESAGTGGSTSLPTPDATGSLALSATAGKVALATVSTALTCAGNCAGAANVRDFVGFGSANNFEGSGPTAAPANATAVLRAANGATDTDNNAADFSVGTPNPRNSAVANAVAGACGSDNGQTLAAAAPTNLCSVGGASAVAGAGHPWSWSCAGIGGGGTASCSATIQSYALAFAPGTNASLTGATTQSVDFGGSATAVTAVENPGYTFTGWTGPNGFTSTANPLVVNGVTAAGTYTANNVPTAAIGACGSDNGQVLAATAPANLCSAGNASAVSGGGHPWNWSCTGTSGTPAACSASIKRYTLSFSAASGGTISGSTTQTVDFGGATTPVTAVPATRATFTSWTGDNGFAATTANPLTIANVAASQNVVAGFKSGFTIFHTNDVHARLTPRQWIGAAHGPGPDQFQQVGGAEYMAGEMLTLVNGQPTALVLDGGDISEGNPVGDMNPSNPGSNSYGNGGMTGFYELMHSKLAQVAGRGGRGIDAMVVGNHDVRNISYIQNMDHMVSVGVPIISANVIDIATGLPHYPATRVVTVNGTKIGIIGYTTSTAQVGASASASIKVIDCQWTGSTTGCNIAAYVNDLRNNQHCDVVILLTHDGHADLVDPKTPVIADTADAKVPEIAITGHWHTWASTVWQPQSLNYKTFFAESSSFMTYIGEVQVSGTGQYLASQQHALVDSTITLDPDVATYVAGLITTYDNAHPGHPYNEVVGYTNDNLMLDDRFKWWSADEYPWSGNNTAGQWITDAMQWKCAQIWGACDIALEAGGGVRSDIPAGPVTYTAVYETFPWADDAYTRVNMTGQDIINFLVANDLDVGFSSALDVTAVDGIPTSVKFNGAPIDPTHVYTVGINSYMYANPPGGYIFTDTAPLNSPLLVRDSLSEFMRTVHPDAAHAYAVGGDRYHFNDRYSGGYTAVVTMMDDAESQPPYDKAFIRLLSANAETLSRRGTLQVPTDLVNADGTIVSSNRLSEQELYRSYLGFKTGKLHAGDIIQVWGKSGAFGGNPEFVDQEGIYADGVEFDIRGHDESLAQPAAVASIGAFWNDNYKNHYVTFLAKKSGGNTVTDQYGQTITIWDATAYNTTPITLPGNVGDVLSITGVPTMENFALRFRLSAAAASTASLPSSVAIASSVTGLPATTGGPLTLNASASSAAGTYFLSPVADAGVASAKPTTNTGTSTNFFVQSANGGSFGNERAWVRFDLSTLPAGQAVTGATLQLWNWKATGAALAAEVEGATSDTWTETGLTWNTQPAFGSALDTQTFAAGAANLYYNWNVGSFVQQKAAGNKLVSLVVKAVTEGSADATSPSYAFDTREYGSTGPLLQVQAQGTVASVQYYARFSTDNATWTAWAAAGAPVTSAPYALAYAFPNGNGYYQFYSVASDAQGHVQPTPAAAQASVQFVASSQSQAITFTPPGSVVVGGTLALSASASSGLPVSFASRTPALCSVSGNVLTAIAAGTCVVEADQAGNASWQAAPAVLANVTVTATAAQTISIVQVAATPLSTGAITLSASASSGLPVTLATQTPAVCSVSGNVATLLAAGTCTVQGTQAGDATHAAAAPVSMSFGVTGASGKVAQVPTPPWALVALGAGLLLLVGLRRRGGQPS